MKTRYLSILCGALAVFLTVQGGIVSAEHHMKPAEWGDDRDRDRSADDWFTAAPDQEEESKDVNETKRRYQPLFVDNDFTYYMDTSSARWIDEPYHSENAQIVDVWIKVSDIGNDVDTDYSYPQKYYLEHYYLKPDTRQIQFLCELEVTGRPSNAIKERKYDSKNWENLVPNSIEDMVYWSVMEKMGKYPKKQKPFKDILEDNFNIAL